MSQDALYPKSEAYFQEAKKHFIGGVNSPVRAFKSVGGSPLFIKEAKGAYLFDEDGNRYIDCIGSWGPMILGHANPLVMDAISKAAQKGTSFGAPHSGETQLASYVKEVLPSCEKLRFVNSGTEAAMSAIRLARGFTKRKLIVKFEGCYHGHADSFLVAAGSGALTLGKPDSDGVPAEIASLTRIVPYNNLEALKKVFKEDGDDIACVIVEPVCGNMGLVLPKLGFLEGLRDLCNCYKSLLIFDEVMTGFRVDVGGAQRLYQVKPDLTLLGKVIGGGLPCAAYGGLREVMSYLAPEGPVYQAGTLSGNPLAMAAGSATLKALVKTDVFERAKANCDCLVERLEKTITDKRWPIQVHRQGTMFGLFFSEKPIESLSDVLACDLDVFPKFFHALLQAGVYWPPSAFEACFMSAAHSKDDINQLFEAVINSLKMTLIR